ncbi:MAG: hypothetical protein EPN99_00360 [Frankiales bacterium]|nr:MAG: hypothetical protein EPN99_00360 [Frankiales bacterium]
MRRAAGLLACGLLLPACSGTLSVTEDRTWRSSAGQAMSDVHATAVRDETCRQPLRLTVGGGALRLRLSNVLSPTPLQLAAVTVGLRSSGPAVRPDSLRAVTVGGASSFGVPAGGAVTTDPVLLATAAGDDLLVSLAVTGEARVSEHRFGAATGWCTGPGTGDRTASATGNDFRNGSRSGLVVDDVAVTSAGAVPASVVAVGDSLTDDALLPADSHRRWTDVLAERLGGRPVVNAAIAGNCIVCEAGYGPPLAARFTRDALSRSGIGSVVVLAGTNDLALRISSQQLIGELQELVAAAHAEGIEVLLVTIPPAAQREPAQLAARHAVNDWIRDDSGADAVVDADRLLRDAAEPEQLAAGYDHGDGLHLSVAGHRALAAEVAAALGE